MKVHRILGKRVGKDLLMLSITIAPEVDTPEVLREYCESFGGEHEGWLYLTGDYHEIDDLRHALGVYDLDPVVDADRTQHSGIITFGNDRTDRWAALPALMNSVEIVETMQRFIGGSRIQALGTHGGG